MINQKIDVTSVSFAQLFKKISDKHLIPALQRPYVWNSKKEVKKFLDDIRENDTNYFIGSFVFVASQEGSIGREEIIDGQQRLVTIILILVAIRDIIEKFKKERELENILRKITNFLNFFDTFDRKQMNRLEFSDKNTNVFFNELLGSSLGIPSTEAEKKIKDNYLFIIKELGGILIDEKNKKLIDDEVNKYFNKIEDLQIIGIVCKDKTIAYELFESINATGLSLASVDLIKNFVLKNSKNNKTLLEQIENKWGKLENLFPENRNELKTYLRHQWISSGEYVSHAGLYGAVEKKHKEKKLDIVKYVDILFEDAKIYLALKNADIKDLKNLNGLTRNDKNNISKVLEFLDFLSVEQVYAPILYLYKQVKNNEFKKYLYKLVAFQFLYKYIPGSPASAEKIFADFAKSGKNKFNNNFEKLNKLVEKSNNEFKEAFLGKAIYRAGMSGDIQFVLERYVFSRGGAEAFKEPTIEHIISQSLSDTNDIHNVGNLTIWEKSGNSSIPEPFNKKIPYYKKSLYIEHREILKNYSFEKKPKESIIVRAGDVADSTFDIFIKMLKSGKFK